MTLQHGPLRLTIAIFVSRINYCLFVAKRFISQLINEPAEAYQSHRQVYETSLQSEATGAVFFYDVGVPT